MTSDPNPRAALEELAAGLLGGAPARAHAAFERAFPEIERHLGVFLRSLGAPRDLWDDCGQATLLRAWRSRAQYRGANRGELLAWLYRICRNELARLMGRAVVRADAPELVDEEESSAQATALDTRWALEGCLAGLPASQRQVVELLYSEAAPTERQVATLTERSKSHVHQLRRAALTALERCLRGKGELP